MEWIKAGVEVAYDADRVLVRKPYGSDKQTLVYHPAAWGDVLSAVRNGPTEEDARPAERAGIYFDDTPGAVVWVWAALNTTDDDLARIELTLAEWNDFCHAIKTGEIN